MKCPFRIAAITILSLFSLPSLAQFQGEVYKPDTSARVYAYGNERTWAFSGGLNTPQLAMADLNNDGKQDLVVYESTINQVRTFINYGTPGTPEYRYRPQYEVNFPDTMSSFMKLKDYNCDGVPDLFHRGPSGFTALKGYYNANSELCFVYYKQLWYQNSIGWTNVYSNPQDIPDVVDIDGDGDLDFFAHDIWNGSEINFYKNMQVEDNLPCDSIRIKHMDQCWGKIYQNYERTHLLEHSCLPPFRPANNGPRDYSVNGIPAKTTLHTGNTICLLDYDGDGDLDYLNGNISFSDLQFLTNGKVENSWPRDSMVEQDTTWQSNGHILHMPSWPVAFHLDIDQDGKKDILIAPHADNASENYKCVAWYRNTGTSASPVFTYQNDSLLTNKSLDMGSGSYPMLYDYDKDGKPDLFIGGDGFYQSNGTLNAKIAYFKNTSTPGNIAFLLQQNDFLSVGTVNIRGAYPAAGDLDNDGKDDLVVGHSSGMISFYKNAAASGSVQPLWLLTVDTLKDVNNVRIDSTQFPAPQIYDIDKDGKKDLIIGSSAGWLYYYRNIGTPGVLKLEYQTSKLGLAKADPFNLFSGHAAPFIGKMDNTGNDYLLLGSNSGRLARYTGFQNGNVTTPFQLIDTAYSGINVSPNRQWNGFRSVPAIADLDGDGKYDMILGNMLGGVLYYKQSFLVSAPDLVNTEYGIHMYPNPAKDVVYLSWGPSFANNTPVQAEIYAITGQKQISKTVNGVNATELSTAHLAAGTYLCILSSGTHRKATKLVILK